MNEAMRPEKGNSVTDERWRSHRLAAAVLRVLIFLVPLAVGFAAGRFVASRLPPTETAYDVASWWVLVIVAATLAATITDKLARRLLPLTILLKMTMLFPDRAPSRMRVALRSGNFTELRKRIERSQRGENTDVGEMSELILSLSAALSRHDRKTRGHSERTRAYTDIIAEEMGLSEEDRDKLRWAALLHDVGKLEVPAEILNKDAKLDDEEWHLVRQHPVFGMKLIAPLVPWLGPWALTVEHHHERYDGTGYPHGLSGSDISVGARIVAVGDAYDVMTSGRSYQRPKTPAAARAEIAEHSGRQFDPVVVRALMNVSLGRLRGATGPIAVLAELPFIRGLPQIGRDAATLLTSSAVMATAMAVGVVPSPATFLPNDVVAIVEAAGDLAAPPGDDAGQPGQPGQPDPGPATTSSAPGSSTTTTTQNPEDTTSTTNPPTSKTTGGTGPNPTTTTTSVPPTSAPLPNGPVALADSASTSEDTPVTLDVLANDTDPTGDIVASSLSIATLPAHGTTSIVSGRVRYTPSENWNGTDRLVYMVCDSTAVCDSATADIEVGPVNDAPVGRPRTVTMAEDDSITVQLETSDVDGDATSCSLAASPPVGAATVPADCARLVFKPSANFFGAVPIRIEVSDGSATSEFVISITVENVNDAPIANDDKASTDWVTRIDIPVLGNDVDADGDRLTLAIATPPPVGSATVNGTSIRYTPTLGAKGVQSMTYRICDPSGACDTAQVSITVAAITIVEDDSVTINRNEAVMIPVSSNDVPGSGRWFRPSFRVVIPPDSGRARDLGWGRIAYSPARNFVGVDSLVYEVCDTNDSCGTATVTITVVEP